MMKVWKKVLLLSFSFFTVSFFSYGSESGGKKNYSLFLGVKQNTGAGEVTFNPSLGINYLHRKNWSLGFSAGYFTSRLGEESFKVFEISKHINYEIRLFHPIYLELGPSFSYLRPLETNGRFNLARHERYGTNFSLAGQISFLVKPSPYNLLFKMSFSPWFSFFEEKLRGYFFSTSLGYRF